MAENNHVDESNYHKVLDGVSKSLVIIRRYL